MEVVLSFYGGEDVGKFEQRDVLPNEMEVRVGFCSVPIDPEPVNFELATAVVIDTSYRSWSLMRNPWPNSECTR
jgi:hypothetical protein